MKALCFQQLAVLSTGEPESLAAAMREHEGSARCQGGLGRFRRICMAAGLIFVSTASRPAVGVSYQAISDGDLIERSPLVIRGRVTSVSAQAYGEALVNTEVRVDVLEVLRGRIRESGITVVVPGGDLGDRGWYVEGAPRFQAGEETLLFLGPWADGSFALTELGLSKFEILMDSRGRLFAARAMFLSGEVPAFVADSETNLEAAEEVRPLDAFLDMIRFSAPGRQQDSLTQRVAIGPSGPLRARPGEPEPTWAEIGALVRWPWTGGSAPTTVRYQPVGGQPNLSDSSNGVARMTNAVLSWPGVSGTDIRVSSPSSGTGGGIQITLNDLTGGSPPFGSPCWTTALCGAGVLGCAGPAWSGTHSFDGRTYNSAVAGYLFMRSYTCPTSADLFENALAHEFGHVLGFGHSDQAISVKDPDQSQFSTNHCLATMRSCIGNCGGSCGSTNNLRVPFSLGADDQTAARYTYPAAMPPPSASRYYAITPCRLFDTRNGSGADAASPILAANATRKFDVSTRCGVPDTALSLTVNVTVTGSGAAGELRIFPGNGISPNPPASAILYAAGKTRANNSIVRLATDGTATLNVQNVSAGTVHFILDVSGYYLLAP